MTIEQEEGISRSAQVEQPAPVSLRGEGICSADDRAAVNAKLTFRSQQTTESLGRFLSGRMFTLTALGWQWEHHMTYFPVSSSQELGEAMSALAEHQKGYLASLLDELPVVKAQLLEAGHRAAAASVEAKIALYQKQFEYVRSHPIQVAFIHVVTTPDRLYPLLRGGDVVLSDCQRIEGGRLRSRRPIPANQKAKSGFSVIRSGYNWAPVYGITIVRANTENGGPYIRNFITWDDVSGFTESTPGYEHDIKLSPMRFTECRILKRLSLPPYYDCMGPWSTDVPSGARAYLDTRTSDNPERDGEDYTIGVGRAMNLATNVTYTTTVYTVKSAADNGSVAIVLQRERPPVSFDEAAFCNLYDEELGWHAACYFVESSLPKGRYSIRAGEQNWINW